jgi:hypothetical protein
MTTLYTHPDDDTLGGNQYSEPRDVVAAWDADLPPHPSRVAKHLRALFAVLTASQQERAVLALGWRRVPSTEVLGASLGASDAPSVAGEQLSGNESSTVARSGERTSANDPQRPGSEADRAARTDDLVRGALEGSHVAQWETLKASAENFGARVWVDGSGFGIQVDGDGMWRQCATLFELRAALSDWVAHERGQGREPRPATPPPPPITFHESDGTERLIVWDAGDMSVGRQQGYRTDDELWEKLVAMFECLKRTWSALAAATARWIAVRPGVEGIAADIERTLDKAAPNWKQGGKP